MQLKLKTIYPPVPKTNPNSMRNHAIPLMIALLCFQACKKDENPPVAEPIAQTILDKIKAEGFSTKDVHRANGGYVVEGCIFFSEKNLNDLMPPLTLLVGQDKQYRTSYLVTGLPKVISVSITGLPAGYGTALDAAIARYNALGLHLTFVRAAADGNIVIKAADLDSSLAQSPGVPAVIGSPASPLLLDQQAIGANPDQNWLTTFIAHQIGHAIGLRHADNLLSESCFGPVNNAGQVTESTVHIPAVQDGTNTNSWMLACIGKNENRPFTKSDSAVLKYLYGVPGLLPVFSGPGATFRKGTEVLDIFVKGDSSHLLHRTWKAAQGWSNWLDLGGNITSQPAVVSRTSNSIDVFAKGTGNNLLHRYWVDGTGWAAWQNLGGNITSAPTVASRDQNFMNVFAKSSTNSLAHLGWNNNAAGWETWEDLGGSIQDAPAAISRQFISINVFCRGTGNTLKHISWSSGLSWSAWEDLGGNITSSPAVVCRVYTTLNVFAKGAGNNLVHLGWNGSAIGWETWENLGGNITSAPAAVSRIENEVDVFAKGTTNHLVKTRWTHALGWSAWESF